MSVANTNAPRIFQPIRTNVNNHLLFGGTLLFADKYLILLLLVFLLIKLGGKSSEIHYHPFSLKIRKNNTNKENSSTCVTFRGCDATMLPIHNNSYPPQHVHDTSLPPYLAGGLRPPGPPIIFLGTSLTNYTT